MSVAETSGKRNPGVANLNGLVAKSISRLLEPVPAASLVVFRIGFGLFMAWWSFDELWTGRVYHLLIAPKFHFTYYPFDFVRPWPGAGMTWHFVALFILALLIASGWMYRTATLLFALGFTYFFLIDRTNYQNHYYLLILISGMMVLLPLNRCFAVDAVIAPANRSETVPAWCLWLVRFHVALPYAFGGLAKLHSDWFSGEPLRTHLTALASISTLGSLLRSEWLVAVLTWGGLLFDMVIVPLLLIRRTRVLAYVLCLGFHLTNSFLFNIHVFPWFMIFATTIFFPTNWPRSVLRLPSLDIAQQSGGSDWFKVPQRVRWRGVFLAIYCVGQLVLPFRPFFYDGNSAWTERGHQFSWRMMMRSKSSAVRYFLTDPKLNATRAVDLRQFVNLTQQVSFSRDPEMILHLAHFIRDEYRQHTGRNAEVRALVLTTLNGRKPELLIDPNIDLAREPRGFYKRTWIMPQEEPLRDVAWSVPISEWHKHVRIPPLRFMNPTEQVGAKTAAATPVVEVCCLSSKVEASDSESILTRGVWNEFSLAKQQVFDSVLHNSDCVGRKSASHRGLLWFQWCL